MPDESTNPTTQTTQNTQSKSAQPWDDFVLDFWDLGEDTPVADIEVDSSLQEEEKAGDELGFDIDLWSSEKEEDNTAESINPETEPKTEKLEDVAEWEDINSDFDISMDYEWSSDKVEEETPDQVSEEEETIPEEEIIPDEELSFENKEEIPEETPDQVSEEEETIPDEELSFENKEEIPEETPDQVSEEEETIPEEEIIPDEELTFENSDNMAAENTEEIDWWEESHLFVQQEDENQNEINFEFDDTHNSTETFQPDSQLDGNTQDEPTFTLEPENGSASATNSQESDEIPFDLNGTSSVKEWATTLDIEPQEQRQPEIWDLLSNSPIDLSKELNDVQETQEQDSWSVELSLDWAKLKSEGDNAEVQLDQPMQTETGESEPILEAPIISQEESAPQAENTEFLLEEPKLESEKSEETPVQQSSQSEIMENKIETESQPAPQNDERSDLVNNAVSQINTTESTQTEINLSAPVELSNMSTNQAETVSQNTETQVQSTLSLDQILDSELLSNPQYSDNSKASPQNIPAWWGKGKLWLYIGVWVGVLAIWVGFLAFPSFIGDRKPGDTVNTWTIVDYTTWIDDPHASAPEVPTTWWEDPLTVDSIEEPDQIEIPEIPSTSWWQWSTTAISIIEDEEETWDTSTSTEPIPYVWEDDWDGDAETQEPEIEELDANQILDVISTFKMQAESYYSYGQEKLDKQIIKYALRLISVCDNYSDRVNNGEGLDSESFLTFKSSANKLLNKLAGGNEETPVIREATIDGESYFEWKDELKDYIYNNR